MLMAVVRIPKSFVHSPHNLHERGGGGGNNKAMLLFSYVFNELVVEKRNV